MNILCECECEGCVQRVELTKEQLAAKGKLILIAETCQRGPEPIDILVEQCDGYSLYRLELLFETAQAYLKGG